MALQKVASAAVLWLLVVAQVVVAGRYYLPQDEASFVQDAGNDCGGDNWKHNFRCIPPMKKTASSAEYEPNSDYVIDNRPYDYTGSDCGPLGKHKYRCVPPTDASASSMDTSANSVDTSTEASSAVQDPIDCGDNYKHNFRCIPSKKTSADNSDVIDNRPFDYTGSDCGPSGEHKFRCVPPMDTSAASESAAFAEVDNRPFDFTGSDCGPLGKHKYRCVPPMDTSAGTSEAASSSVQGTIDHTGKDCGDKWKHFFPCIPPKKSTTSSADNDDSNSDMDKSRFSSHAKRWVDTLPAHVEVDNRPVDYTGSDCGPLGKHKYRCVPPLP